MIFTLFNLFKFVRVFYWRILLSHFCIFFGFITMWRYWNSFPLERETVCSCRFLSKLIRVKFKQTLNSGDWVESLSALIEHVDGTWEIYHYEECLFENEVSEKTA